VNLPTSAGRLSGRLIPAVVLALLVPWVAHAQLLTVSAAASLTEAFRGIGSAFEAAVPGTTVRFNFAASGTLLQQIAQGAPVDVYASADQETMNRGAARGLWEPGSRRDFATNQLVLIGPVEGKGLQNLKDLFAPDVRRIAIGKPATVPAGRYTKELLESVELWAGLEGKFVQADSVRQVLDYVSRGEAEAGFVYRTDAALMPDKVRIALTPAVPTAVSYPAAVVADSRQKDLAKRFVDFLSSPQARAILERLGFGSTAP
jgi:molybdate transport system substrate-binding protein